MFLWILGMAIVLVAIGGLILAIKFYRKKRFPICSAAAGNFKKYGKCNICGAERIEDCIKMKSDSSQEEIPQSN